MVKPSTEMMPCEVGLVVTVMETWLFAEVVLVVVTVEVVVCAVVAFRVVGRHRLALRGNGVGEAPHLQLANARRLPI